MKKGQEQLLTLGVKASGPQYRPNECTSENAVLFLAHLVLDIQSHLCHRLQILLEAFHPRGSVYAGHCFAENDLDGCICLVQPLALVAFFGPGGEDRQRQGDGKTRTPRVRCWRLRVRAGGKERGKEQQHGDTREGASLRVYWKNAGSFRLHFLANLASVLFVHTSFPRMN